MPSRPRAAPARPSAVSPNDRRGPRPWSRPSATGSGSSVPASRPSPASARSSPVSPATGTVSSSSLPTGASKWTATVSRISPDRLPCRGKRIVRRPRRRRRRMGTYRLAHRDGETEPCRALRLAQGHSRSHRHRPSKQPRRRTPALELQASVKLKAGCSARIAYRPARPAGRNRSSRGRRRKTQVAPASTGIACAAAMSLTFAAVTDAWSGCPACAS